MSTRPERVRPRRLESDTLSYLKEVTETLVQDNEDISTEETEIMLWNVLEELAPRAASAASDRHGGELLELLLPRSSDGQLRYLLSKMEGYYSHLWTNRYSSHVLQHILSRASTVVEKELNGDVAKEEQLNETPLMSALIVSMVTEVEQEWLTLMNDVSASHVFRSVLAVLAGRPLVAEKRGKKAKHRVITFTEEPSSNTVMYQVPASFTTLYQNLTHTFQELPASDAMTLLYDRNAGPLLASMLKLANSSLQESLVSYVLQWGDEQQSIHVFYDLAGDTVTSHWIEALFQAVSDDWFSRIVRRCMLGKLIEFSDHSIANYVVQHAIARISEVALAHDVLNELESSLWTLLSAHRAGVIYRLVEMCRRLNINLQPLYTALTAAVNKQEEKKPEVARKSFVPALLSLQLATSASQNKVHVNVMGAKIIGELLQVEYQNWLAPLYEGIVNNFNTAQLVALAMDSTGSRCVIEPIWETTSPDQLWAREALFSKLTGQFGTLAMNRIGAFSVMKCYEKMSVPNKIIIAEELLAVEGKLTGCHFAQLVMNTVNLYEFRNNREKWKALYEKQEKVAELFKDFNDDSVSTKKEKKEKKEKKDKKRLREREQNGKTEKDEDIAVIMNVLKTGGPSNKKKIKHVTKG